MADLLIGILIGALAAAGMGLAWRLRRSWRRGGREPIATIHSSIEELRSIGELSVFKIFTRQIVTARDHWFGDIGKRYFEWMVSSKKMAMIISFDIDFRYDLNAADFVIQREGPEAYRLTMPKCLYETHIKDVHFYDEQNSRLLPWLLPDLLNRAFGSGFNEEDKNRLIEEAKQQASAESEALVLKMRSEVQNSARNTLAALARGFGATRVTVDFSGSKIVQAGVEYDSSRNPSLAEEEAA